MCSSWPGRRPADSRRASNRRLNGITSRQWGHLRRSRWALLAIALTATVARWLFEGHAEWTAYRGIDRIGLLGIDRARAQMDRHYKAHAPTPLFALEVRGRPPDGGMYDIGALAIDFLLR